LMQQRSSRKTASKYFYLSRILLMSETKQAKQERMSYEIIERNGDTISSITPITTGQTISITEGGSFSVRISKIGSDTTRWGGYSYWQIKSDQDISTVWNDQAEIYAPWSFWSNNSRSKISTGLYLPVQDSVNWEIAKITDGAPPIQYKEDWDSNLIYTPYVEYKIKTTDDNIYSGDKLMKIKLSLDANSIKTSSTRQQNTGNNVISVDTSLSSTDFNLRIIDNDEQVNKVYATSYQGREGDWVTIRFRRIGDITQYAGINIQASGFTYPNSPAATITSLYPYENYSSGWHGDWSLDQGNSISGNRVLIFAPGESEVAFQILLRSDNYAEQTERLAFNVEDLGNLYSNRTYNGRYLQKITIEGSTSIDPQWAQVTSPRDRLSDLHHTRSRRRRHG